MGKATLTVRTTDLGSEYRLSNELGHGAGLNTIIKPGNGWHQDNARQVFFPALPPWVGPALMRSRACDNLHLDTRYRFLHVTLCAMFTAPGSVKTES